MGSEFRTIGRHAMVYGTGVVLGKLASFLMLPIYTRYLTPSDYGVLELLGMTIDVIALVAGVGLSAGVFKFYAELERTADKRELISTVALAASGIAAATAIAGIIFSGPLTQLVLRGAGNPNYFRIFFLIYFFQAAGAPAMLLMRIQERSVLFVSLNLAKLVLSLALNIYFVVVRHMGLSGVLLSTVIVSGLTALFLASYTFRHVGFGFSAVLFRRLVRFGAPIVLWALGSFVLTFSDRYFLNYLTGATAVGIYALAYRFSFALSALAVLPFELVWEPRRFEIAKQADAGDVFRRMFFFLNLALIGGATIIVALVRDVLRVMADPAYMPAAQVIPLLLAVTVVQQWTAYCNIGLYLRNRTDLYAWSALTGVLVALALNALLIPRFGIMGAGWATVAAYVVRFLTVYTISQAQYRIHYPWGKVSVLALLFTGVYGLRSVVRFDSLVVSVSYSMVLLAVAGILAYQLLLSADERTAIRDLLFRSRNPRPVTAT